MKFNYQARTKDGSIESGTIEASSQKAAVDVLHQNGLFPTSIKEVSPNKIIQKINVLAGTSFKEVVVFSRELATMLDSKVPLAEALDSLADQTKNQNFQEQIYRIATSIREGSTFSKAISAYPKIFSNFFVNMVKSGEASGNLSDVLDRVSSHLEKDYELKSKMAGAMIYPAIVLFVFVVIFAVIMIYVIPNLTAVLKVSGRELPAITQSVISTSNFLKQWWIAILGLLIFSVFSFARYNKTENGKRVVDGLLLKLPVLGPFLKNIYLARFAENFSVLITAGIPIAQALDISADVIGNSIYRDIILDSRARVVKGEPFSSTLDRYPEQVPALFVQMASVGERTGRISTTLMNIVRFYQREIDIFVGNLSNILEPILIIGLAGMVAFLMAAVVLPLYQMNSNLN